MKQLYNTVITDKAESNVTKTQVFYYLNNVLKNCDRFNIFITKDRKIIIERLYE